MEEKKKCKTCKREKLRWNEILMMVFGFVMMGFAVYGMVHFVKGLIN
jgi:hypothetical protein